jgi:hypothetical protein
MASTLQRHQEYHGPCRYRRRPVRESAAPRTPPFPPLEPRPKPLPVTEQLIADVIASGGELHIDREKDKANYETRVGAAIRHGKVPEGKLLTVEHGTWRVDHQAAGSARVDDHGT